VRTVVCTVKMVREVATTESPDLSSDKRYSDASSHLVHGEAKLMSEAALLPLLDMLVEVLQDWPELIYCENRCAGTAWSKRGTLRAVEDQREGTD